MSEKLERLRCHWTAEELDWLTHYYYAGKKSTQIAHLLKRSAASVELRLQQMAQDGAVRLRPNAPHLGIKQLSCELGVPNRTISEWMKKGILSTVSTGPMRRYRVVLETELYRFIRSEWYRLSPPLMPEGKWKSYLMKILDREAGQWMNCKEVAVLKRVSVSLVNSAILRGKLAGMNQAGVNAVRRSDALAWTPDIKRSRSIKRAWRERRKAA